MEVLGSDGDLVGIVDHVERAGGVILTKDDPASGPLFAIPLEWVFHVECKVHLRQPAAEAKAGLVRH